MRQLRPVLSFRRIAAILLAALALGSVTPNAARAANAVEKNFWLEGPRYEGQPAACETLLDTITLRFAQKERRFWNSNLEIVRFLNVHETALRPWRYEGIPRRFCTGRAVISDGKTRVIHFSVIEDGGFASIGDGVEFCIIGLDRNWAFNPACRAARP